MNQDQINEDAVTLIKNGKVQQLKAMLDAGLIRANDMLLFLSTHRVPILCIAAASRVHGGVICQELLGRGADPNDNRSSMGPPLFWSQTCDSVRVLLRAGADMRAKNSVGLRLDQVSMATPPAARMLAFARRRARPTVTGPLSHSDFMRFTIERARSFYVTKKGDRSSMKKSDLQKLIKDLWPVLDFVDVTTQQNGNAYFSATWSEDIFAKEGDTTVFWESAGPMSFSVAAWRSERERAELERVPMPCLRIPHETNQNARIRL